MDNFHQKLEKTEPLRSAFNPRDETQRDLISIQLMSNYLLDAILMRPRYWHIIDHPTNPIHNCMPAFPFAPPVKKQTP